MFNLANLAPAGLWKLCLWEGVFWCPLRYSNGEILGNFIWFCNSCWGQFGTWKIWQFVPKWGGQREGRWEFASHVFRVSFILLWYHTFFQIKKHFGPRGSLSANNISGNVHLSWIWFTGVLALCSKTWGKVCGRRTRWQGLDTELHWFDLPEFSQIASNWADSL